MCSVKDRSFENDAQIKDYSTLSSIKDPSSENNSRIPDAHWAHVAFSTETKSPFRPGQDRRRFSNWGHLDRRTIICGPVGSRLPTQQTTGMRLMGVFAHGIFHEEIVARNIPHETFHEKLSMRNHSRES